MIVKTHKGPVEVEAGRPFVEAIRDVARRVELTAFRVFVGGQEVGQDNAPATLNEDMVVGIQPDDIAG